MNKRSLLVLSVLAGQRLCRAVRRHPWWTGAGMLALAVATCSGDPAIEPNTTLTKSFTIKGLGEACRVYDNGVNQGKRAYVAVTTQDYANLVFTRTSEGCFGTK